MGRTIQVFSIFQSSNSQKHYLKSELGSPWICLGIPGSPKINNIGFGARGHIRKSRNHRNNVLEGSHISKSTSHKFKSKQNNTTEFLSISSHKFIIKMPQILQTHSNMFVF